MMFTTRDTKGHTQMCLTFIFKVNHQGQVTDFGFSEILNIVNVRIDTKIKSAACIQPELRKVIQWNVCDLEFQGQPLRSPWIFSTLLISSTSKMLESTPRSSLCHVYNPRYERSCKKVFDLDFQGHAMKIEFFHYYCWIPWPRKHTHEKYFRKIGREGKNPGGWYPPPLRRFRLAKYLSCLRVNTDNTKVAQEEIVSEPAHQLDLGENRNIGYVLEPQI